LLISAAIAGGYKDYRMDRKKREGKPKLPE